MQVLDGSTQIFNDSRHALDNDLAHRLRMLHKMGK